MVRFHLVLCGLFIFFINFQSSDFDGNRKRGRDSTNDDGTALAYHAYDSSFSIVGRPQNRF